MPSKSPKHKRAHYTTAMNETTKQLITLLRDRGLHEQADQLVANWEQIATMQARIEQLTQDLAEQRKSNEKYAALHGVSNWEQ